MATVPLKLAVAQAKIEKDVQVRDAWMRRMKSSRAGEHILVGDGITVADVLRWLEEALETA